MEKLPLPDILAIQVTEKWVEVNPLDPKSDWHLISPYHITPESSTKVMGIVMITNSRLLNKFSLSASLEMYGEQYGEYAYWC